VYQLQTSKMEELGESRAMEVGDTWELPEGSGSITFTGFSDYISLQTNRDGSRPFALGAAVVAVAGLLLTLFVRPRRVWVRVEEGEDGRSRVVLAALSKTAVADDHQELHAPATRLTARLHDETDDTPASD